MAGFHNPFSAKPDYAGGLSDLANMVMQFLMVNKMGQGGQGAGQKMPQSPQMPQMPQGSAQAGGMAGAGGQGMAQARPKATTRPGSGMPPLAGAEPQNIQVLMQALPPDLQAVLIGLLQSGTFKEFKPPTQGQSQGR